MLKYLIPLILVLAPISCTKKDVWATTSAKVINVGAYSDNNWAYSYEYTAAESTAKNASGEPIRGPLQQHTMVQGKKPVENQEVKIRYRKDDPVIFEVLEEIQFE